jgi:hypothetical protein
MLIWRIRVGFYWKDRARPCRKSAGRLVHCSERYGCQRVLSRGSASACRVTGVSGFPPRIATGRIQRFACSSLRASPRWAAGLAARLAAVAGNEALHVDLVVAVSLRRQARARAGPQTERPDRPPGEAAGAVLLMPTRPRLDKRTLRPIGVLGVGPWRFCHASGQPS